MFESFGAKVFGGESWRQRCGEAAYLFDGVWIGVRGKDFVPLLQKINQVAAGTAARIEDAHAARDAAPQELVKEVDVDLAELPLEVFEHPTFYRHILAPRWTFAAG